MIERFRAHRKERTAQREYLQRMTRNETSRIDRLEWTPEMLDRLAADVFGSDA